MKAQSKVAQQVTETSVGSIFRTIKPAPLAQRIDDLGQLRSLLRQSQEAERQLSNEIKALLAEAGTSEARGLEYVATVSERVDTVVDPELWLEATGKRGLVALTVSVTRARELMGEEDIRAISEPRTTPVLNVKPLAGGAK